jgi:uncharacterized protein YjbI with pentapeptide repeats/outer membrane protein assembly factor BamB
VNGLNWLNGRIAAAAAGAAALLATGAAVAVPSLATARASAVTCPTVDPATGAVTPAPSAGVNWSGCDLAGADFTSATVNFANLSGANLTNAVLTNAQFIHANFTGANLTGVSGSNAGFNSAALVGADLSGAHLPGGVFNLANFTSAKLVGADLDHSAAGGIKTGKADFTHVNLSFARLEQANFSGANLTGADLSYARLTKTVLAGANLAGVKSGHLQRIPQSLPGSFSMTDGYLVGPYADLAGADLAGAIAVNDSFAHADLTKADLAGADLNSADFDSANAAGALLKGADLTGAELTATNANLKNVAWSAGTTCPNGRAASATGCFAKPAVARPPAIQVSIRRGGPGSTLTLTGSGFADRETLTVSLDGGKLATVTTGSAGSAGPLTLTVPRSAQPGLHRITAAGNGKTQTAGAWFTVATNWDQAAYDSGLTNYNPVENALTPAKARTLTKKFLFSPGAGASGAYAPSIDDGVAYIASGKGPLTAVSAATGKTLWTWKEPGGWDAARTTPHDQLSQPVLLNGVLYLSVAGQGLAAISSSSGKLIWTSNLGAVNLAQPTRYQGVLYTTDHGTLYAVDAAIGESLRQRIANPFHRAHPLLGQPAVAGGVMYVRGSNGILYAYAAYSTATPDLTPLWTYTVPGTPQTGRLAVSGGTIYLTTSTASGGGLVAISASTRKQEWQVKTAAKLNAPAIAGRTVYLVTQNGLLIALNAATGAHRWTANLHDTSSGSDTFHPAVAGGVVYALSNAGTAYAFNATTGALLWSHPSGGALRTVPVIANGILYIGTKSGGVEAFAAR